MEDKFIIIPERVYRDTRIPSRVHELYGLLYTLSRNNGVCYAGNTFLSNRLNRKTETISRDLKVLEDYGLIARNVDNESGKRYIKVIDQTVIGIDHMVNGVDETVKWSCSYGQESIDHMVKHRINRENTIESKNAPVKKKPFKSPTVDEVKAYCLERKNSVDAEHFVDYYEARGWQLGKGPMRDWKATVRTLEKREKSDRQAPARPDTPKLRWSTNENGEREAVYDE